MTQNKHKYMLDKDKLIIVYRIPKKGFDLERLYEMSRTFKLDDSVIQHYIIDKTINRIEIEVLNPKYITEQEHIEEMKQLEEKLRDMYELVLKKEQNIVI